MDLFLELLVVWECGGGTVLIFCLTNFLQKSQHLAQGANLIFFIPTSIVSMIVNWKNRNIKLKTAIIVIICGIIGSIIGAKISVNLNVKLLRKIFGFFLLIIAINEFYSLVKLYKKNKNKDNKKELN